MQLSLRITFKVDYYKPYQPVLYWLKHVHLHKTAIGICVHCHILRRAISQIPMLSLLSCKICFNCSIAIGFCAMLQIFWGAKRHQSQEHLLLERVGQHAGMSGMLPKKIIPDPGSTYRNNTPEGGSTCKNGEAIKEGQFKTKLLNEWKRMPFRFQCA